MAWITLLFGLSDGRAGGVMNDTPAHWAGREPAFQPDGLWAHERCGACENARGRDGARNADDARGL